MATIEFRCPGCGAELETDVELGGDSSQCPGCGKTVLIPLAGIKSGTKIAGFVIERQLGVGGMGEVWLATQTAMGRKVALKILAPALARDQAFIDRFMEEVRTSANLDHPNIVTAHDAGCENDVYYLAMSFVDGEELSNRLHAGGKLPEPEALRVARGVAVALQYAWDRNRILHRDIKPANIMISSDGVVKLMDMGISKSLSENSELTMTGVIVGTPHYMSPEQALAEGELDCRADIYSLGATLYHAVTGQVPYDSTTAMGILTKHITDPFPPPRERNPELSEACAVLLETMMAKKPEDRQQDWAAVLRDIDLVMSGKMPATSRPGVGKSQVMRVDDALATRTAVKRPVKARRVGVQSVPVEPSSSPKSRSPVSITAAVAGILLAIGGVALLSQSSKPTAPPAVEVEAPSPVEPLSMPDPLREPAPDHPTADALQEAWDQATRHTETNPDDIGGAIAAFEDILRRATGTRYEPLARDELAKLRQRQVIGPPDIPEEPDPIPPEPVVVADVPETPPPPPVVSEPKQPEIEVPELARAMTIYRGQIDAIKEETGKLHTDLNQRYIEALQQLERDLRDRGDLRNVLTVRNETDRFTRNPDTEIEDIAAFPEAMQPLCNTLVTYRKRYADEESARIIDLTQRFLRHLNTIKMDLTRQNRIEDALAVEKETAAVLLSPYLAPTLNIVVEADRRNVEAKIEQTKGPAAVLGNDGMYRLETGTEYEFEVSYTDTRPDRRWQTETLSVTADWRGGAASSDSDAGVSGSGRGSELGVAIYRHGIRLDTSHEYVGWQVRGDQR